MVCVLLRHFPRRGAFRTPQHRGKRAILADAGDDQHTHDVDNRHQWPSGLRVMLSIAITYDTSCQGNRPVSYFGAPLTQNIMDSMWEVV